jgi:hypothetical protein
VYQTKIIRLLKESPEKYSWWLNELESLGLAVKSANDLNDISPQFGRQYKTGIISRLQNLL